MSDAVCGPSNPLQQFKQQSQYDRTLQQDRLTSRSSPAQGFRSIDPNAGLLDPEFEAFEAGVPPSELPLYQFQSQQQFIPQSFAPSSASPSWAADFQRMQISSPPPASSFARQKSTQASPVAANWAHGFKNHIAQAAPRAQNSSSSPLAFQQRARYGLTGYQSSFQQPNYALPPAIQSKGKERLTEEFDDAAFERAFDQARDEMMAEERTMSENLEDTTQLHGEVSASKSDVLKEIFRNIDEASGQEQLPLEAVTADDAEALREALDRQESTQESNLQQEEDDLAATAQELLEKVEHNQTDKFRNSQFLNLMRKLRDREVKVEGDKMIDTANPTMSSTSSLNKTTLSTSPPLFDNTEQRPSPLGGVQQAAPPVVDTRPPDYGLSSIPAHEQDHDLGRVQPNDGQAVVDLLSQAPGAMEEESGESSYLEYLDSSVPERSREARSAVAASGQGGSLSEMLYGADGTLAQPISWRNQ